MHKSCVNLSSKCKFQVLMLLFPLQHVRQTVLTRTGSKNHVENVEEETEAAVAQAIAPETRAPPPPQVRSLVLGEVRDKSEVRAGVKTEARTGAKSEARLEAKSEARSGAKSEARSIGICGLSDKV